MTTSHVPGLFTEAGAQLNQGKFAKTWDDSAGAMGRPVGGTMFVSDDQNTGVSASAAVLPMSIQG